MVFFKNRNINLALTECMYLLYLYENEIVTYKLVDS